MYTLSDLSSELFILEEKLMLAEKMRQKILQQLDISQNEAGRNMIHYLSLRSEDIRGLQDNLHISGLDHQQDRNYGGRYGLFYKFLEHKNLLLCLISLR